MSRCVICGCTDARACPEGCGWIVPPRAGVGLCSTEACQRAALNTLKAFKKLRGAKIPARRRAR